MMYQYEQAGCTGTQYMDAEAGLTQKALVIGDGIWFPSGTVAERPVGSMAADSGGCFDLPPGFTQRSGEAKWVPLSSLGLSGQFHLSR